MHFVRQAGPPAVVHLLHARFVVVVAVVVNFHRLLTCCFGFISKRGVDYINTSTTTLCTHGWNISRLLQQKTDINSPTPEPIYLVSLITHLFLAAHERRCAGLWGGRPRRVHLRPFRPPAPSAVVVPDEVTFHKEQHPSERGYRPGVGGGAVYFVQVYE